MSEYEFKTFRKCLTMHKSCVLARLHIYTDTESPKKFYWKSLLPPDCILRNRLCRISMYGCSKQNYCTITNQKFLIHYAHALHKKSKLSNNELYRHPCKISILISTCRINSIKLACKSIFQSHSVCKSVRECKSNRINMAKTGAKINNLHVLNCPALLHRQKK
jgi:hypothetical protein